MLTLKKNRQLNKNAHWHKLPLLQRHRTKKGKINLKVGILIDRFNVGGVEKIALEEVRAFREIGIKAELLVLSRRAVIKNAFKDLRDDIPVTYLDDRLPRAFKFSFKLPFFYFFSLFHLTYPIFLPFYIKSKEIDLIVSHNTYTSFTAFTLSKFRSIPYIIYVWDPISYILKKAYTKGPIAALNFLLVPLGRFIDRLLVNRASAVLVSGDCHDEYLGRILKDGSKKFFLPPGHDPKMKVPSKRGDYVFTATAWKEGKGLENLIQIISEIKSARLKIAGKWIHGSYLKKIKYLIDKLKISDRVEILGEITEQRLNQLYGKARVSVIVNDERGFGLLALEAAANGCPFIIPEECGAARYFKDGQDGFYFRFGDNKVLKENIEKFISDERLAYEMGKHAWTVVKNKYSWEMHVRKIKNIIGCINKK